MEALSYRPRNAGHDYYGRGTYLITLVVSGRERLREKADLHSDEGTLIRSMSKKQRQEYYSFVGRQHRPVLETREKAL